ncbi:DUF3828 domain-containing protein [Capnocytophaga periodontitidis]|uniref:DUF3828 domain-containing protein n=1 Tax=Capnocytophaga periodontitidis TaxID=2795027 RepID=UPI0018E12A6F|nr:DUF3828 domain-containing protein [Capnocytophaga periodontitidis]MBI1669424.1 DUF3828 domain-containing protein [Capnocytophaga periodontitidis]
MVKIYYFISACLLLFACNNNNNTQVSLETDTTDTISSIKRDTIVEKDTIAPIQASKEETDEATKMILEFYDKYIRQQDKMPCGEFCEEELREIEREFLSSKLIRKVNSDELSSDPIVKAQDTNLKWLDSLKVKKINSKRYNVYIFDFFLNRYDSVQLKVAKKKDKYIIDDIIF